MRDTGREVSMTENQVSDKPFWSDSRRKGRSIFFIVLGTFVLTLPYSIFSIFFYPLLKFPTGLLFLAGNTLDIEEIYWQQADIPSLLVWMLYIGMAIAIVRSKTEKTVRILYIMLVLLLILNVAGCQIIGPEIMAGVE
jgi:hypothetical protein